MKARHTVLGYGTKVWFQMPDAAASCQTPRNTTTDSSGSAARVSRPRQGSEPSRTGAAEAISSGSDVNEDRH